MNTREKVENLRKFMKQKGIDAYIVPSCDAHQSEYVAEHWRGRAWLSGFTGSAGTVVITKDKGGLWTDGRYYIQAARELKDSGIDLFKAAEPGTPSFTDWLKDNLSEGQVVGFDGKVFSVNDYRNMVKKFSKKGIKVETSYDLLDQIWEDRPAVPCTPVFLHDVKFAGKSRVEKLQEVRNAISKVNANYYLLTSLDDIAWLFNIRGRDVKNNPVTIAYAVIGMDKAYLFIDEDKVNKEVKEELEKDNIELRSYDSVSEFLTTLSADDCVFLDTSKTSIYLFNSIKDEVEKAEDTNITTKLKCVKNKVEMENMRKCHVRDGVAMVKFIHWLKSNIGKEEITELSASDKAESFRKEGDLFIETSFNTIAGYKDHAAMMHYSATKETQYALKPEGFLLIDSGAQYYDGTTDITRTICLGKLSEEEKRDFTLVLKGHIDLAMAKFLYGTTGSNLDILARRPLWNEGIDYKCGTGHGVGLCLNVHEGPQRISVAPNTVRFEEGMVITNEPGVYKEGKHGIRTENILLVLKDKCTEYGGQFMKFETITHCPIDLDAVVVEMLTEEERNWLNNYHGMVYNTLSPYLNEEEREFLKKETREI